MIDENLHGYSLAADPDDEGVVIMRQGIIPGLQGYKPIHITHLSDGNILVICQTNYELSIAKRKSIIKGAAIFFNQLQSKL